MAKNAVQEMSKPQCSLTETLEEVNQQGLAQDIELKRNEEVLFGLKDTLLKVEKNREIVQLELNTTERRIYRHEDEMVQLQNHTSDLESESQTIYMENMQLKHQTEEEGDLSLLELAGYNTYRNKMENHKMAIFRKESQTAIHRKLVEKRVIIKKLAEKREELRADLHNPEGNVMRQAQKETDELKVQVSAMKDLISEKTKLLEKEQDIHTQLRKDTEIQNRRSEAIVKRLLCQLNKAQTNHRELSDDICRLENEAGDLRRRVQMKEYTQAEF